MQTTRNNDNQNTYSQLFQTLSVALYYDQDRKRFHGISTGLIGKRLAEDGSFCDPGEAFYAGLIHDLGGLGLTHHIVHYALASPGERNKLSSGEIKQSKNHGPLGASKLKSFQSFNWTFSFLRDHHERYDGSGYPEGKSGPDVPVEAEVVGAADTLDLYLCSLGSEGGPTKDAKRVDGFVDFLQSHGGFRNELRDGLLSIASDENFVVNLLSSGALEEAAKEAIETLAAPGSISLEELVKLLGEVIDIKSNYTEDHSDRVATLGEEVGKSMEMNESQLRDYRYASYLHDLGKVGVDRSILNKPDSLTEDEYEQVKRHPTYSRQLLSEIDKLEEVAEIVGQHHERYDGTGYPEGLAGEEIKLEARIIAVADAWDAMTSPRPYQPPLQRKQAARELKENAGSQFDPRVVEQFLQVVDEVERKVERA